MISTTNTSTAVKCYSYYIYTLMTYIWLETTAIITVIITRAIKYYLFIITTLACGNLGPLYYLYLFTLSIAYKWLINFSKSSVLSLFSTMFILRQLFFIPVIVLSLFDNRNWQSDKHTRLLSERQTQTGSDSTELKAQCEISQLGGLSPTRSTFWKIRIETAQKRKTCHQGADKEDSIWGSPDVNHRGRTMEIWEWNWVLMLQLRPLLGDGWYYTENNAKKCVWFLMRWCPFTVCS